MGTRPKSDRTILIIEDEMDMRFYIVTMIKTLGYDTVVARNGIEGMKVLEKIRPDLIILDVMMPEKGGALVYKEIKSNAVYEDIPLIVFSGVNRDSFNHYVRMLNVNLKAKIEEPEYYVEKTVDPDYLMKLIKQMIEQ